MAGYMNGAVMGALAGIAGGAAMALMRMTVAPRLPEKMRPGEFVPKKAVEWAEERTGRPEALSESAEMTAGMVSHLGYSALTGSLYGLARPLTTGGRRHVWPGGMGRELRGLDAGGGHDGANHQQACREVDGSPDGSHGLRRDHGTGARSARA
jgi:hypothetical protein